MSEETGPLRRVTAQVQHIARAIDTAILAARRLGIDDQGTASLLDDLVERIADLKFDAVYLADVLVAVLQESEG